MSEKYKTYEGGLFFVTLSVVGWIDIFTRKEVCELVVDNLNFCIKNKGLKIYAYVIMSSHIHLVARSENGLLTSILRDFKSYTSKKIIQLIKESNFESRKDWLTYMFEYFGKYNKHNAKYQFWQQNNHPIDLNNNYLIDQKVDYIHQNPVEAGIVGEPHHYVYSSAYPIAKIQIEDL